MKIKDVHFLNTPFTREKTASFVPEAEIVNGLIYFSVAGVMLVKPLNELKQATVIAEETAVTIQSPPPNQQQPAPVNPVRRRKS